jgi:hypothetical protein
MTVALGFMRRIVTVSLVAAAIFCSTPASAQEEKGLFGIGVIIGEPTGVSAKYYLSDTTAFDAAVGGAFIKSGIQGHADFLWHPWTLESQSSFVLPAYLGPGLRVLVRDGDGSKESATFIGLRGVVGALLDFRKLPLDVFVEVAGVVDYGIADAEDDKGFGLSINAGAGVRYYF